jgi:hypothetical protein
MDKMNLFMEKIGSMVQRSEVQCVELSSFELKILGYNFISARIHAGANMLGYCKYQAGSPFNL